jgi:hypothetical protein
MRENNTRPWGSCRMCKNGAPSSSTDFTTQVVAKEKVQRDSPHPFPVFLLAASPPVDGPSSRPTTIHSLLRADLESSAQVAHERMRFLEENFPGSFSKSMNSQCASGLTSPRLVRLARWLWSRRVRPEGETAKPCATILAPSTGRMRHQYAKKVAAFHLKTCSTHTSASQRSAARPRTDTAALVTRHTGDRQACW